MKKLLLAVAAFGMLLTSCAKDDAVAPVVEKEAFVSFCVNTPAVATRAYGDGTTATTLYYAVYDQNGLVTTLQDEVPINISTTVNLKLIQGRTYDVLFWAANAEAPYDVDWENKTMTIDYSRAFANQESYDAFYKYEQLGEVSGAVSKTIELTRPFAQLNIATTEADEQAAAKAGLNISETSMAVSKICKTLNFVDGSISNPVSANDYFKSAAKATGTITVGETTYNQISMNYLLVNEHNLVDVALGINGELTRTYYSVPVQRNYRTNIIGNILTSPADFDVKIVPAFAEPDENYVAPEHVATLEQLEEAMKEGKRSFILDADITTAKAYDLKILEKTTTRSGQDCISIDLNGHFWELPMLNVMATQAIIKNGTIKGKVYARKNTDVTFENLTFSGAVADNLSTEGHLAIQGGCKSVYAKNCLFSPTSVSGTQTKPLSFEGGSTIIKFEGCEFKSSPYKKQVYLNSLSATGSVDFTNCNFNNKTPNIMFAAACPLTNVTMSGTTKLSSVTFETNRAKEAVTEADLAYLRTLIANNSFSSVRLFYAGGSSEYIR